MKGTIQYSGNLATHFEGTLGRLRNYDSETKFIKTFLASMRDASITFVDLGCGTGKHLHALRRYFSLGVGIDIAPDMLAVAKQRIDGKVKLLEADLRKGIPLAQDSAHCVIALFNLFQSLALDQDLHLLFSEVGRILKIGGLLLCDFHNEVLLNKKYPYGSTGVVRLERGYEAHLTATLSDRTKILHIEFQDSSGAITQSTTHKLRVVSLGEVL